MPSKKRGWKQGGGGGKKRRKYGAIDPSKRLNAIMVTCDQGKENQCTHEMINWLSEWYESVCPSTEEEDTKEVKEGGSVASELEAELAALRKQKSNSKGSSANFIPIKDVMGRGIVLIKINKQVGMDAVDVVKGVLRTLDSDAAATDPSDEEVTEEAMGIKSRFAVRMLPFSTTCFSKMDDLKETIAPLIQTRFSQLPDTASKFAIDVKSRGKNANMKRSDIIETVAPMVPPGYTVDLQNPDVVIIVHVMGRFTGLSVVTEYQQLHKFNIRAFMPGYAAANQKMQRERHERKDKVRALMAANAAKSDSANDSAPSSSVATSSTTIDGEVTSSSSSSVLVPDLASEPEPEPSSEVGKTV